MTGHQLQLIIEGGKAPSDTHVIPRRAVLTQSSGHRPSSGYASPFPVLRVVPHIPDRPVPPRSALPTPLRGLLAPHLPASVAAAVPTVHPRPPRFLATSLSDGAPATLSSRLSLLRS